MRPFLQLCYRNAIKMLIIFGCVIATYRIARISNITYLYSQKTIFNIQIKTKNQYLQPEQIRLSYGDRSNDIMVTWSTKNCTSAHVKFGENIPDQEANGTSVVYIEPTRNNTQWIHRTLLKQLKYGTIYFYIVGSQFGWSEQLTFKTYPEGNNSVVSIVAYGDLGLSNSLIISYLEKDIAKNHYDAVLHIGDMVYDIHDNHGAKCDEFLKKLQPIASKIPYMVCIGNHEVQDTYNFSQYKARFSMPGPYENMFHTFNIGPIHFISINSEAYFDLKRYDKPTTDYKTLVKYYKLLKNDLDEATKPENRDKRPWIIVFGHRPFYCSNSNDGVNCPRGYLPNRDGVKKVGGYGLEVLLKNYGVDFALWGHEHSYERFWPVYKFKVYNGSRENPYTNPKALVQVTTGAAGSNEFINPFFKEVEEWSAFRSEEYGYGRFYCHNKTHLYYQQLSVADHKGNLYRSSRIIDSFWLVRNKHSPYNI